MLAFEKKLGDPAIEDVIAALRTFQAGKRRRPPSIFHLAPPPLPLGPVPLEIRTGPSRSGFKAESLGTTSCVELIHAATAARFAKLAVLDARAPSDYMGEHIAGAVSVPFPTTQIRTSTNSRRHPG